MTKKVRLWKATIPCPPDLALPLSDFLEDEALSVSCYAPPRQPVAEVEAIYDAPPDEGAFRERLALFSAQQGATDLTATIEEIVDLDWIKKVAEDFPPLPIGPWLIYGATYKNEASKAPLGLQIDATSAFGTGEHPTTRGCLLMLEKVLQKTKPQRMLDMGCGSGILAMAFAKATKCKAVAVDMDEDSVEIARQNAEINGVADHMQIDCSLGYQNKIVTESAPYDLIMSNIFADPLCELAKDLKAHLAPSGHVILAGLLNSQAPAVIKAHEDQGISLLETSVDGEWSILLLRNA